MAAILVWTAPLLAAGDLELTDADDRISYSVGYQVGGDLKTQGVQVDADALIRGIQDALAGSEPLMSGGAMRTTLVELNRRMLAAEREQAARAAKQSLDQGNAFLAQNAGKEGVVTRPSGLQYRVIQAGAGKSPGAEGVVTVHYRGRLLDGTEFDSSYSRNAPATFQVDRVIPGWSEALQLMQEGAKWELYIPSDLAYGAQGAGSRIGANSALVFEVELLSVK